MTDGDVVMEEPKLSKIDKVSILCPICGNFRVASINLLLADIERRFKELRGLMKTKTMKAANEINNPETIRQHIKEKGYLVGWCDFCLNRVMNYMVVLEKENPDILGKSLTKDWIML